MIKFDGEIMMDTNEIYQRVNQCKPLIKNWALMEGIDFDFTLLEIDGLLVDKKEDWRGEGWEYSLLTTIYTKMNDRGRDVYAVRWRFKDLWGNRAFFTYEGPEIGGSLKLSYIDYDDFALAGFSIVSNKNSEVLKYDENDEVSWETEADVPIFKFEQPDEVSIASVEKTAHQTLQDIDPEDDEPFNDTF